MINTGTAFPRSIFITDEGMKLDMDMESSVNTIRV